MTEWVTNRWADDGWPDNQDWEVVVSVVQEALHEVFRMRIRPCILGGVGVITGFQDVLQFLYGVLVYRIGADFPSRTLPSGRNILTYAVDVCTKSFNLGKAVVICASSSRVGNSVRLLRPVHCSMRFLQPSE